MIEERREEDRINVNLNINWHRIEENGKYLNTNLTEDISKNGMGIITDIFLNKDEDLKLNFNLPNHLYPISCIAKVFRCQVIHNNFKNKYLTGLKIVDIDIATFDKLEEFIIYHPFVKRPAETKKRKFGFL